MKINRSTQCSLKFITKLKRKALVSILHEYGRVVNMFIGQFWVLCPKKTELLKPIVDSVDSWFSARLRKVAAREAIDMVKSSRNRHKDKAVRPVHRGKRMHVSSSTAALIPAKKAHTFDYWLHLSSIGNHMIFDLPIKSHKHFNDLAARGKRLESYIITEKSIQFCFQIETGPKKEPNRRVGVDTGINALASLSNGKQLGMDTKTAIERIKRCKHGSKGQKRAVNALHQRMNEVAKQVVSEFDLVVTENLKGITKNTKYKLRKNIRKSIARWSVRYWLETLKKKCEDSRVIFRSVPSYYTSQTCSSCGYVDRKNRNREMFLCQKCNHTDNADINAAKNILFRFITGPYGAGFKPKIVDLSII